MWPGSRRLEFTPGRKCFLPRVCDGPYIALTDFTRYACIRVGGYTETVDEKANKNGGLAAIHIGTSGWHYEHWKGKFYPRTIASSEMLRWYAQSFETVELNNSFYRLPRKIDFRHWGEAVPERFLFTVKASRFITHRKRLRAVGTAGKKFISRAEGLGQKLGAILFQLPPNWRAVPERLERFLSVLTPDHRYVFEFRDTRWYCPEVMEILKRYRVALCLHDWRGMQWPVQFTTDFTYIRFHGSEGAYQGGYSASSLRNWAENIRDWQRHLSTVFVYFNNDLQGHAIENARFLQHLLQRNPKPKAA
jgi:uncharacterized protein YecE (DUF72 family)